MLGIPYVCNRDIELCIEGQWKYIRMKPKSYLLLDNTPKTRKMFFSTKDRFCNIFDFN